MYCYLLVISMFICINAINEPVIRTKFGPIRGKWMKSQNDVIIAAYLGIPYAQPPIGQLRFKSPKSWQQHWTNVHSVDMDGPNCPQLNNNMEIIGDENCLNLNIFVPQISDKQKLPVLVYIHGGAFMTGSNNSTLLAPDYLLDQEIILVTVNYRLGILGFLSSGNEASPGNYGLKDIIEALFWIQSNIESFGGNSNLVTLAGHSAGASIAHHLALSNRTEGLFDKIITHSGSANAPWAIHTVKSAKVRYIALAIRLGCATNQKIMEIHYPNKGIEKNYENIVEDDVDIVECLRKKSMEEITNMTNYYHVWRTEPTINFGPTIEPESEDAVITKYPMVTIENKEFRDIPWVSGVVKDEGYIKSLSMALDMDILDEFYEEFEELAPLIMEQEEIIDDYEEYSKQLLEFYMPGVNHSNLLDNITMMIGDGLFIYWSFEAFTTQSSLMNSSTFFFQFSYDGTFTHSLCCDTTQQYGILHGDDMNYIFPSYNKIFEDLQLHNTLDDKTMINIMTEMWANFAKTGIPSAQLSPHWQPYQEDFRFMKLGMGRLPDISMVNDFLPERIEFWNNLMSSVGTPRDKLFPQIISYDENEEMAANQLTINTTSVRDSAQSILSHTRIIFIIAIACIIF